MQGRSHTERVPSPSGERVPLTKAAQRCEPKRDGRRQEAVDARRPVEPDERPLSCGLEQVRSRLLDGGELIGKRSGRHPGA